MSFDKGQNMDDDEINLAELLRSIWFSKFILLIFLVLSIPLSIIFSKYFEPTYKAETVFEKPSQSSNQESSSLRSSVESLGLMSFLNSRPIGGSNDSFFSEIRSESFLKTVILNNAEIDSQMLQKFCPLPSKETSRFSLRALLILLGISENRAPSENQKISLLVQCVNEMLELQLDSFGAVKSNTGSAYRLSIESGDPNFSANLANQIVEQYFVRHETKRDQRFQKVKEYLSKVITEAQVEFTEANKLMQNFIIKNTSLMNIETAINDNADVNLPLPPSPFEAKLKKDFFSLGQLEKSLSQFTLARSKLSYLKDFSQNEIEKAISLTDVQEVLSRTFITSIAKIERLSTGANFKNQEIKKIVSQELKSLEGRIQALENKINNIEEQTLQLMTIENRYQELAIDVSKKKFMFEGLKDQLKEKIFTAGLANIAQPVLLTKAVPPYNKAFPNKKIILAVGVILSIFMGVGYILIRQSSTRRIHSLSQIKRISRFINCYAIKYKQLKLMGERSNESVIGQSFFSHSMGMGKLGCIIDLSQKRHKNSLALDFSKAFANLLVAENSKIVCLDTSLSKKPFSSSKWKNFASHESDPSVKGIMSKNILSVSDVDGMVEAGDIKKIKSKYSDYDKIICTLGAEIGDFAKFKFIEQCDFYILVGRSFHFDEYTYKKFSNTVWEKEKKCLGLFLIN